MIVLNNSYLDKLTERTGIRVEFYDPAGIRYGFPTFPYRQAPPWLATRRQLRTQSLRSAGQPVIAQIMWRHRKQTRIAYLYDRRQAKPKRTATAAQLAAIDKALTARRTCRHCGVTRAYYIPRRTGACLICEPGR